MRNIFRGIGYFIIGIIALLIVGIRYVIENGEIFISNIQMIRKLQRNLKSLDED